MGPQKLAPPPSGPDRVRVGDRQDELDLTLLVCTHNNARLLERALESVAQQALPHTVRCETLVVANRCTDRTQEVVRRLAADGRIPLLRYVTESRPGVSFARRRGFRESRGRLIGFVDDDCLLAPDWAAQALRFAEEHPRAGAFGGRNELLWEVPPTGIAELYGESLARQDHGNAPRRMPVNEWRMPVGAGLVVCRDAVISSGWIDRGVLRARTPRNLGAGEDAEIALRIRRAGWQIWYSPRLRLRHVIPRDRMTLAYLRRLHRGFGRADVFLRALATTPAPWPRFEGVVWAVRVLLQVLRRFPDGFIRYRDERPTWLIRLSYARGCVEGSVRFLVTGRGW